MKYYKEIISGNMGEFSDMQLIPPAGWEEALQADIDLYLLNKAKEAKIFELKDKLHIFRTAGYEYSGIIICDVWSNQESYSMHALVSAVDQKNYKSLINDNLGNDPIISPERWEEFKPEFRVDEKTIINLGTVSDYEFFTKSENDGYRHRINFGSEVNWNNFKDVLMSEEDRLMKKYNQYRADIAVCTTQQEIDDIIIDFEE